MTIRKDANLALVAAGAAMLLVLPFVTTFNDLLTAWAMQLSVIGPLAGVADVEARMATGLLDLAGIHAVAAGNGYLLVDDLHGRQQQLYITWNCVGWQSLVLLGLSFLTGFHSRHPVEARFQVFVIGLLGTVLVNVLRITAVCLLAAVAGRDPAIIFHDYGGTLLILAWLFGFWAVAQRWLLPEIAPEEEAE
jgi:exosortase/archaeosortase family protein